MWIKNLACKAIDPDTPWKSCVEIFNEKPIPKDSIFINNVLLSNEWCLYEV